MSTPHVRVGAGEHKVLCLPGWFGSSTGWGHWPELLDGETFSYVFVDYRGYGGRIGVEGEHSMAEIAADVLALADELDWADFSLIGHSMGGIAMQRVLADAPGRVRKMVGISPVPASGVPFDDQQWNVFVGAAHEDGNRGAIIDLTTGNRLSKTWLAQMVEHSVRHSTREAFGDYLPAWAKTDFAADIEGTPVPVLVVVGEHDPALGRTTAEATWLKHYPNATLEVMSNAGHYAMFETPVALATSVEAFLGS